MNDLKNHGNGRILFADDDTLFREGLTAVLIRHGFECCSAVSASEALEHLRTKEFDVLLSDIHMPGNDNLEFVREASLTVPGLPIVLLTGMPAVETAAQSVQLPVIAYLVKPPDIEQLVSLLRRAVHDHRQHRVLRTCRQRLQQWDNELGEIEQRFRKTTPKGIEPNNGFINLMLRNFILTLVDLERSIATLCHQCAPANLHQAELVGALRRTVAVLEKTKQNFKSKDLGELRKELEQLLGVCR